VPYLFFDPQKETEFGSDGPMVFDDVEELWAMWIDLHESFDVRFSEEEREVIDALELPRPDGL
jgi:hypothetical protein